MKLNNTYFFTCTIIDWRPLLEEEIYKRIILDSLRYLCDKGCIKIYSFVIMPNHVHLIWKLLKLNGKELPSSSFLKFTSHKLLELVKIRNKEKLSWLTSQLSDSKYQIWIPKSREFNLYSSKLFEQKMDYIHNNPVQGKWLLADCPVDYYYSSAKFYEDGVDDFGFVTHHSEW
jgi:putative transposase